MKSPIKTFVLLLFLLSSQSAFAQIIDNISVSLLNEAVELTPFNDFLPINPGIEIGTNLWRKDRKRSGSQLNTYLGFYHNKNLSNAFYLKAEYVFQTKIMNTIGIDLLPSVGYQHYFYPGDVYDLNESTGKYEKVNQSGIARATGGLGLGITYLNDSRIEPFVRYEVVVDFPQKLLTVLPNTIFKIGANYQFSSDK